MWGERKLSTSATQQVTLQLFDKEMNEEWKKITKNSKENIKKMQKFVNF